MRVKIIGAVVILLLIGAAALLGVQNAGRTTQLSADIYFAAWQLRDPVSVPLSEVMIGTTIDWMVEFKRPRLERKFF